MTLSLDPRCWTAAEAPAPVSEPHERVAITNRRMLLDGRSWIPVSGEIHYSRVPRSEWRERLLLMRSGGIDVIAAYLFWNHHEQPDGSLSFDDRLDVAAFVRLCAELDLLVVLRIGPWAHGESRNGGFPDRVQRAAVAHRTDDPAYLDLVRPWYAAVGEQLGGLCGPASNVIGIQIENELYDQPQHLATLKRMAIEAGLNAPLFTATAWGGAQLPAAELLPLYSGYGDGFWAEASAPWDETFRAHFQFSDEWDDPGVGADVRGEAGVAGERDTAFPPATCELGGGMASTYHRRIVPSGADIAAVANAKLGSGSAWQGFYMYAGGANPPGTELQESHATDYPNDLPRYDYGFQAAVGASGELGAAHAPLRAQHAFLRAFAEQLAATPTSWPAVLPSGIDDAATLRWAHRGGFVFVNRHQPHVPLPPLHGVQLRVGERTLPHDPVTVPPGTIARWPVGLDLDGAVLEYATASALTVLDDGELVLVADEGVPVEFAVDPAVVVEGDVRSVAPGVYRADVETAASVRVGGAVLVLLPTRDADRLWVLETPSGRELLRSEAPLWHDGDRLVARSGAEPVVDRWTASGWERLAAEGASAAHPPRPVEAHRVSDALPPLVGYGTSQGRASAPGADVVADRAAELRLTGLGAAQTGVRRLLTLHWAGDVGHFEVDGVLVADRFWDGGAWTLDLDALGAGDEATLRILPLHRDAEIWLEAAAHDRRRSAREPEAVLDGAALERVAAWTLARA